jgi:hypothetical protein
MAISPFTARPGSPENEGRRARIVIALVALGISASLLAYAVSPSVRHAVGHAAHSVKHAVGRVFDHDTPAHKHKHATVVRVHTRKPGAHAPAHSAQGAGVAHTPAVPATGAHTSTSGGTPARLSTPGG